MKKRNLRLVKQLEEKLKEQQFVQVLDSMLEDGLITIRDGDIKLTAKGAALGQAAAEKLGMELPDQDQTITVEASATTEAEVEAPVPEAGEEAQTPTEDSVASDENTVEENIS